MPSAVSRSFVLSIDIGTSSVRASLYDLLGEPVPGAAEGVRHEPDVTADGGVEMEANGLVDRILGCIDRLLRRLEIRPGEIEAVATCSFWHSAVGVGKDGHPITPILVWADTRSHAQSLRLKAAFDESTVHARTGCLFHTSFLPARLAWVREARPEWWGAVHRWLSPGEYLYQRLLGEARCSVSMASGTGLYRHDTGDWDRELLAWLEMEPHQLAELVDTSQPLQGLRSEFAHRFPALDRIPWFPAAGDGACSNVGAGCVSADRVALMVGTSGAMRVMRSSDGPGNGTDHEDREPAPPPGLWKYRLDRRRYAIGGALSNGGILHSWLTETLNFAQGERAAAELESWLAEAEPDAHGLTVLPFLAGERCPGWRGDARAAIVGLSLSTEPRQILQAGLESVAYRFALIHELLSPVADPDHQLIATGGALLASRAWTQMMADALGRPVSASTVSEASSRGAALVALEAIGHLPNLAALPAPVGERFLPRPERLQKFTAARRRQADLYRTLIGNAWTSS